MFCSIKHTACSKTGRRAYLYSKGNFSDGTKVVLTEHFRKITPNLKNNIKMNY